MRLLLGILILLASYTFSLLAAWYPDVAWLNAIHLAVVWPAVVALLGIGLITAAPALNRRDPVLVGWVAFGLCGCLLLAPLFLAKISQEQFDEAIAREVSSRQRDLQAEWRRKSQDALDKARSERTSRPKDRFTQYEGRIDARSLARIRALDQEMESALKRKGEEYKAALEQYPTRGPDEWVRTKTREELAQERLAHRKLYEAARGFTQFVESFEDSYTEAVHELALQPPADRVAIAEMQRILQAAEANKVYELRMLDVEAIGAALEALNILFEEWDYWSFDLREQSLSFENPAGEAAFYAALQRLSVAAEAVQAIAEPISEEN